MGGFSPQFNHTVAAGGYRGLAGEHQQGPGSIIGRKCPPDPVDGRLIEIIEDGIENQQGGLANQGPRQHDATRLGRREGRTAGADFGLQAIGQIDGQFLFQSQPGQEGRDGFMTHRLTSQSYIFQYGISDHFDGADQRHPFPQGFKTNVPEIEAIEFYPSGVRITQPHDQLGQRTFTGSRASQNRQSFTAANIQIEVGQHMGRTPRIAEADLMDMQGGRTGTEASTATAGFAFRRQIDQMTKFVDRSQKVIEILQLLAKLDESRQHRRHDQFGGDQLP